MDTQPNKLGLVFNSFPSKRLIVYKKNKKTQNVLVFQINLVEIFFFFYIIQKIVQR